jgi:hypothetical protein
MQRFGLFTDLDRTCLQPAGKSIDVLDDTSGKNVQPEIYFPAPPTPAHERRFRKNLVPGEIVLHPGLRDQKLPGLDFRYGIKTVKGESAAAAMKAGERVGIAAYRQSVAERVYDSTTKEPLGRGYNRGHSIHVPQKGFGLPSGVPEDAKFAIFPVDMPADPEEVRRLYRDTHGNFAPGEQVCRKYNYPNGIQDDAHFRFGIKQQTAHGVEGTGVRMVLSMDRAEDDTVPVTKLVPRTVEDYRNVQHPRRGTKCNYKKGSDHEGKAFGIPTKFNESAAAAIAGDYNLEEQLPDKDLGCCLKLGLRNMTRERRAFGVPSVRTDLPAPDPLRRSVADMRSFGDEAGTGALLNPQRFDAIGVPDREFLLRRPRAEIEALVEATGKAELAGADFDSVWQEAVSLFSDGLDLVSLDAILYVLSGKIDERVKKRLKGFGGTIGVDPQSPATESCAPG